VLFRQRVKTVTHVVELLNFAQDCTRMHGKRGFPENRTEKQISCGATRFIQPEKGSGYLFSTIPSATQHHKEDKASVAEASPIPIGLAAPARVSPAPAAEQKQNQENNQ
jgi:hypothetical protein